MPTKDEQAHLDAVAALGCVVCRNEGLGPTPACCHHLREGYGASQRASDYETLPLCPPHHTDADGTAKYAGHIAFHRYRGTWQTRYGTEIQLLRQTLQELGRHDLIALYISAP